MRLVSNPNRRARARLLPAICAVAAALSLWLAESGPALADRGPAHADRPAALATTPDQDRPAAAEAPDEGPYLVHPARRQGESLDVLAGSVYDGAEAIVYKIDGTDTQSWVLERRDDVPGVEGAYAIVNVKTGRLLAVDLEGPAASADGDGGGLDRDARSARGPSSDAVSRLQGTSLAPPPLDLDGYPVCQQVDHEVTEWVGRIDRLAQRWTVSPVGDGAYRISPVLDQKSALIVVANGKPDYSGVALARTTSTRLTDAQWTFERSRLSEAARAMIKRAHDVESPTGYLVLIDIVNHYLGVFEGRRGAWELVRWCSCGNGAWGTPSPVGTFSMGDKGYYFDSEDGARCFYFSQIWGSYLIHSTLYWPWSEAPDYTMDPTLGAYESHGCIRLDLADAYYVYTVVPETTTIVLYE